MLRYSLQICCPPCSQWLILYHLIGFHLDDQKKNFKWHIKFFGHSSILFEDHQTLSEIDCTTFEPNLEKVFKQAFLTWFF